MPNLFHSVFFVLSIIDYKCLDFADAKPKVIKKKLVRFTCEITSETWVVNFYVSCFVVCVYLKIYPGQKRSHFSDS